MTTNAALINGRANGNERGGSCMMKQEALLAMLVLVGGNGRQASKVKCG
jgi:hypothetical protein